MSKLHSMFSFLVLMLIVSSCSAITGIFKAGMGVGIVIVLVIIIIIAAIIMKANKK